MRSARARAASRMSSASRRVLARKSSRSFEQPAGGAQLVGQALDRLLEQLEHLFAVDHHRRRQRHRPRARDHLGDSAQQRFALGMLVAQRRAGARRRARPVHRAAGGRRLGRTRALVVVHRHGFEKRSRMRAATGFGHHRRHVTAEAGDVADVLRRDGRAGRRRRQEHGVHARDVEVHLRLGHLALEVGRRPAGP